VRKHRSSVHCGSSDKPVFNPHKPAIHQASTDYAYWTLTSEASRIGSW
jgi:hypothetical protein